MKGDAKIAGLSAVFGQPVFARLSRSELGPLSFIERVIIDHKLPSDEPITDWHADQFDEHGRCIKFMLYLNDIGAENGAFSYVPGSHLLTRALSSVLDETVCELHLVEDIRSKASKFMAEDPAARSNIKRLLDDMEQHIASAKVSDDHYTVSASAGSVVVFDANGVHRGGVVRERERLIARCHWRPFQAAKTLSSPQSIISAAERLFLHWTAPAGMPSLV
jgi:hypothetical protein